MIKGVVCRSHLVFNLQSVGPSVSPFHPGGLLCLESILFCPRCSDQDYRPNLVRFKRFQLWYFFVRFWAQKHTSALLPTDCWKAKPASRTRSQDQFNFQHYSATLLCIELTDWKGDRTYIVWPRKNCRNLSFLFKRHPSLWHTWQFRHAYKPYNLSMNPIKLTNCEWSATRPTYYEKKWRKKTNKKVTNFFVCMFSFSLSFLVVILQGPRRTGLYPPHANLQLDRRVVRFYVNYRALSSEVFFPQGS